MRNFAALITAFLLIVGLGRAQAPTPSFFYTTEHWERCVIFGEYYHCTPYTKSYTHTFVSQEWHRVAPVEVSGDHGDALIHFVSVDGSKMLVQMIRVAGGGVQVGDWFAYFDDEIGGITANDLIPGITEAEEDNRRTSSTLPALCEVTTRRGLIVGSLEPPYDEIGALYYGDVVPCAPRDGNYWRVECHRCSEPIGWAHADYLDIVEE